MLSNVSKKFVKRRDRGDLAAGQMTVKSDKVFTISCLQVWETELASPLDSAGGKVYTSPISKDAWAKALLSGRTAAS